MPDAEAEELMRSAWAKRRASFDAPPEEKLALLTRAQVDLTSAATMCRDQASPVSHAHAIHLLANVEVDLGHQERALSLWEEAVELLRATDDFLQLAHKVRHLGDLHRHCDRLSDADVCYSEALTIYRAHDGEGSLDFANAIRRMAKLKELQGDRTQALALWRETRESYAAIEMTPGVEEADACIARLTD